MRRFCLFAALLCCFVLSCTRPAGRNVVEVNSADTPPFSDAPSSPPVKPLAIVQAGEFPLWFQFTGEGPVLIETIEDACFSAALVPWPLAPHVRFMLAQGDDLLIAVNHDGFIRLSPYEAASIGLYYFSGGEFWRRYTVGAFVLFDEKPSALLYRDDRFFDSDEAIPSPRLWTFDRYSAGMQPQTLPALDAFAPEDGWDVDALRRGADGFWYFRAVKKMASRPEIRMLRSGDLAREGETVSLGAFQNAALPEPLSAAPDPLGEMLAAVFAENNCGLASVVSPEFQTVRSFAANREKAAISGFFSGAFFMAAFPNGSALYMEVPAARSIRYFSLPSLPEGFVYTGIGICGDTIFASWEEQHEYSIGAAGFMVLRLTDVP